MGHVQASFSPPFSARGTHPVPLAIFLFFHISDPAFPTCAFFVTLCRCIIGKWGLTGGENHLFVTIFTFFPAVRHLVSYPFPSV
jgi:hypothetical protein